MLPRVFSVATSGKTHQLAMSGMALETTASHPAQNDQMRGMSVIAVMAMSTANGMPDFR